MEKAPQNLELILKYFSEFTPAQLDQLAALDALYKDWNSKINVISRKDIEGLYEKHVLHSLAILAVNSFRPGSEILDIGTGGGFPGIPLAIILPEVQFHLADSIGKKLKVVEEIKSALELKNVTTQHIRVEEIKGRKFDYTMSRAVAPLKDLWYWSKPLLRKKRHEPTSQLAAQEPPPFRPGAEKTPPYQEGRIGPASQKGKIGPPSQEGKIEYYATGLVCLKGGDLAEEIAACKTPVSGVEIYNVFPEQFFREKFVLHVRL